MHRVMQVCIIALGHEACIPLCASRILAPPSAHKVTSHVDRLGVAVIGLHMGYGHLVNCQTHPRATFAAVCLAA